MNNFSEKNNFDYLITKSGKDIIRFHILFIRNCELYIHWTCLLQAGIANYKIEK